MDVTTLSGLLRETEERHAAYEATAPQHDWADWYAAYLTARGNGRAPDEAAADAAHHLESIRQ